MTVIDPNPAQRQLVHEFIDWKIVEQRLQRFPAIGRAFPIKRLRSRQESPPYYCHYMAWRLGTWTDESPIHRLEELLRCAEALPNWKHEKSLLLSFEFDVFWSLVWQLQVAEYLCEVGSDVRWAAAGPDLSVVVNNNRWFVECYTPRKSFGLLLFLTELLERLDSAIHTSYDLCMRFHLPLNSKRSEFLDAILSPFLVPSYLEDAKNAATKKYPVLLFTDPSSSLRVYVEGADVDAYTPGIIQNQVGSPEAYLKVVLREAVQAKQGANGLDRHRPNLVAVNFLLSTDYQLAISSPRPVGWREEFETEHGVDALSVSVLGIDRRLTKRALQVVHVSDAERSRVSEFADVV